jgi:hypothetical protein
MRKLLSNQLWDVLQNSSDDAKLNSYQENLNQTFGSVIAAKVDAIRQNNSEQPNYMSDELYTYLKQDVMENHKEYTDAVQNSKTELAQSIKDTPDLLTNLYNTSKTQIDYDVLNTENWLSSCREDELNTLFKNTSADHKKLLNRYLSTRKEEHNYFVECFTKNKDNFDMLKNLFTSTSVTDYPFQQDELVLLHNAGETHNYINDNSYSVRGLKLYSGRRDRVLETPFSLPGASNTSVRQFQHQGEGAGFHYSQVKNH